MEGCLLVKKTNDEALGDSKKLTWDVFIEEAKRIMYIAGPMIAVTISLYFLQVISMMMVGHLGELALSSTAIATSLSAVTGTSLLSGLAAGLETICGQAYGAKQYKKLGDQTNGAIFSLLIVACFVSLVWINMEKLLILIGQDPLIAHEAGRFTRWLIPGLFANAVFQPIVRFYQAQSLVMPMLIVALCTLCLHVPLCWFLVFKSGLENLGGAIAISFSLWLNIICHGLYIKYSTACEKTRAPISMEMFHGIGEFFRFAIPSVLMICLQWWSYEFIVLLSGLLPNPQLETSVLSICLTTLATLYSMPYGLSAAASTRVSNALGAGNPVSARISAYTVIFLTAADLLIVSGTLLASRHVFGYCFSSYLDVVDYVSNIAPLLCLSVIIDGSQGTLSGIARGSGWQNIGAYINLGSLYLCGIPSAALLGFWLRFNGRGLWMGLQIGAFVQAVLLTVVTLKTDWKKLASEARERIFAGKSQAADLLI